MHSTVFVFKTRFENLPFLIFFLFKFVAEAAPGRTDAATSKKYVTAQPHFFHIQ